MEVPTLEARLAVWADVVSLILLCGAVLISGIEPRRRVWGQTFHRNILLAFAMTINVIFSTGRFIAEGVLVATGPREFLVISVIYSARWLWLFVSISKSGTRSAKAFKVARALRELKTIRLRVSGKEERKGEKELVIRRGERIVKGRLYWRGVEESADFIKGRDTYIIRLVERELHSNLLDEIGTVQFKRALEMDSNDGLYKKFYDLVITVDMMDPDLVVDYTPFLRAYGHVAADTRQAQRVGATDTSDLGQIARRVAADACYYIWHDDAEFRTERHVEVINQCVEDAAMSYLGTDSADCIV